MRIKMTRNIMMININLTMEFPVVAVFSCRVLDSSIALVHAIYHDEYLTNFLPVKLLLLVKTGSYEGKYLTLL